jgi:hypothetical protein
VFELSQRFILIVLHFEDLKKGVGVQRISEIIKEAKIIIQRVVFLLSEKTA